MKPTAMTLAIAAFTATVPLPSRAQQATDPTLQRVEITGSSIKRIDAETSLPVTVINREEIRRTGATSTEQLMTTITSLGSAGASGAAQSSSQITFGASTISLRGLGSNRTLVLVNGRRLATFAAGPGADSGSVDVSSIPLAAIERVEILRDGASGVYGSDAVAGVVNFILRRDYTGFEGTAAVDVPTRGEAQTYRAGLLFGTGSDEGRSHNFMLAANFERSRGLLAKDRSFSKNSYNPPIYDGSFLGSGIVEGAWVPGEPYANQVLAPIGGIGGPNSPDNCAVQGNFYNELANDCWWDYAPWAQIIPEQERVNLIGSGRIAIGGGHEAYGELMLARTTTKTYDSPFVYQAQYLSGDTVFQQAGIEPALLIYPGNPNYPSAWLQADPARAALDGQPLAVTYRLNQISPRRRENVADQQRALAGARGLIGTWDYDVAALLNRSRVNESALQGYQLQAGFVSQINNPASTWNPFGEPDATVLGALANADFRGRVVSSESRSTGIDGKVSTDLMALPGGPLGLALGASLRRDSYQQDPSAAGQSGDISGYGQAMRPVDVSRNVNAVFAELAAPLSKTLEAGLALRYDDYSRIGGATSPKASLRWQPLRQVLLRGSIGRGFRAPSFVESDLPAQFISTAFVEDPQTGVTSSWIGTSSGNPNLKPEKSNQTSLGLVLSPVDNVSLSFDAFAIEIKGAISTPPVGLILQKEAEGDPFYSSLVTRTANGDIANIDIVPLNLNKLQVSGVDVDLSWRQNTGIGRVGLGLTGTYIAKYDVTLADGTVQGSVGRIVDDNGVPLVAVGSGGVVLRWRHALTASLARGDWGAAFTQRFQSGYGDNFDFNGEARRIPSFTTYDLNLAYRGFKNTDISVGAKNLFDRDPPVFAGFYQYIFSGFDPSNYDARGRTVYANLTYRFH